jgi:hypothetical protein
MQLALVYDAAHAGADDWTEILAWFRRAVDVLGHKEVAYRLDVQPSNLTDAINERERKDVKAKWITVVLRMCPETLRREYLEIVGGHHGFEVKRARVRTPEEELRDMRELLKREAPGVLALVDKEMGR